MSQIRLITDDDLDDYITLQANAYPVIKVNSEDDRQRIKKRLIKQRDDSRVHTYGLFRDKKMVGAMKFYDFAMNLFMNPVSVGGLGQVAVDLIHKKEKICREIVSFFHQHYYENGAALTILYPFRPDFYRKMGYGYGTKISQYKVKPEHLPKGKSKEHVRFLKQDDIPAITACQNRFYEKTHGMIKEPEIKYAMMMENNLSLRFVGYERDGRIEAYLIFGYESAHKRNFVMNDIIVHELIYEHPEALSEIMTFLHSQSDQINAVVFNSLDENLHHLFADPRNGTGNLIPSVSHESNTCGVGLMYRVINLPQIIGTLKEHNFGTFNGLMKLAVKDTFFDKGWGDFLIEFHNGKPRLVDSGTPAFTFTIEISDFSSLLVGAVDFISLYMYGRAGISDDKFLDVAQKMFQPARKPVCLTDF
jgi:predicted acetyltransferase